MGKAFDRFVDKLFEIKTGDEFPSIEVDTLVGHLKELSNETQEFPGSEFLIEEGKVGHEGHAFTGFERVGLEVEAADASGSGSWLHQSGEDFQGGGFTGGIGTEDGEELPAGNLESDVVDGDQFAEFFYQVKEFDHGWESAEGRGGDRVRN